MTNQEVIEILKYIKARKADPDNDEKYALDIAIKALEKDMCSTCKHYDANYGETCLNPNGTCRVFENDGYEPRGE